MLSSVAFFLAGAGSCITGSAAVTLRHLLTPSSLHARMNASYRMLQFAVIPAAAGLAGVLVEVAGARTMLWICPVVLLSAAVPLTTRSVRTLRLPGEASRPRPPGQ